MAFTQDTSSSLISGFVLSSNQSLNTIPGFTSSSTLLELQGTDWAMVFNSMTTAQRDALVNPVNGMIIYNTDVQAGGAIQARENGAWVTLSNGAGGVIVASLGAVGAPGFTFTTRTDTGFYSSAANTLDVASNGARQAQFTGTLNAVNYAVITGGITANNPSISVAGSDPVIGLNLVVKGASSVNIIGNAVGGANNAELRLYNSTNTLFSTLSCNPTASTIFTLPGQPPTLFSTGGTPPITMDSFGNMQCTAIGPEIYTQTASIPFGTFRAMSTNPILIIPAPGANMVLVLRYAVVKTVSTGTGYAGGGVMGFEYDFVAARAGVAASNTSAASSLATGNNPRIFNFTGTIAPGDTSVIANKGLYLSCDTGDFTAGSGNVLVDVWYSILNTAS